MSDPLAIAIAKRFIQRKDVKAIQYENGYAPDREGPNHNGPNKPWSMADVEAHLAGTATYGHYLVDENDNCKLFAFDIDLIKSPSVYPDKLDYTCFDEQDNFTGQATFMNPREAWRDRRHPARSWLKWELGFTAGHLAAAISKELELPVAAAYSGHKGIHVYGFTGETTAAEARAGALLVLESLGSWKLSKGQSLFYHQDQSVLGFGAINLEVYPKQDSLKGKDLGNLLRLPLGRNLRSPEDPTFFLDLKKNPGDLAPHPDPYNLLRSGNPWA